MFCNYAVYIYANTISLRHKARAKLPMKKGKLNKTVVANVDVQDSDSDAVELM